MASVEILKFSKTAAKLCNHLQKSAAALKEFVDRHPIRLDSASNTFLQSVNRRENAAGVDLNMLESMTFGTGRIKVISSRSTTTSAPPHLTIIHLIYLSRKLGSKDAIFYCKLTFESRYKEIGEKIHNNEERAMFFEQSPFDPTLG